MDCFVPEDSVVRKIWGKSDTVLFIFAGAAAEFALNKAVDWLYFTGKLPADPIGRLFSTVSYAGAIIFSDTRTALASIDRMSDIHAGVESARGYTIPEEAYRDVLFMLIHYSIAAFELLERKLTNEEKEEVVDVFIRVGRRMGIKSLPLGYDAWRVMHIAQLEENLVASTYTANLYDQYRKHLGFFRYYVLIQAQYLLVPLPVKRLLNPEPSFLFNGVLAAYKYSRRWKVIGFVKTALLPSSYRERIKSLDR